jgi:hypothetical protein
MTKTLNHIIFFSPPKSEYIFQQHWESEYFFGKKIIPSPPTKLNGRSLNIVINGLGYEIMHGNRLIIYTLYDYHWVI